METSLKEWIQSEKPWEKDTWEKFLMEDLIPFYETAYRIYAIREFFETQIVKKSSISDVQDNPIEERLKMAVHGGISGDRESREGKSFARFMYEIFGVSTVGGSFEESIKKYEEKGPYGTKIVLIDDCYLKKIGIDDIVSKTSELIKNMSKRLYGEKAKDILKEKNTDISTSPCTVVPDKNTSYSHDELYRKYFKEFIPTKSYSSAQSITELVSEFERRALSLAVGVSPHMTFAFYMRYIPLEVLRQLLGDDIDLKRTKELMETLGPNPYTAYSMTDDMNVVEMPRKMNPTVFLMYEKYNGGVLRSLQNLIKTFIGVEKDSGFKNNGFYKKHREIFLDFSSENLKSLSPSIYPHDEEGELEESFAKVFRDMSEKNLSSEYAYITIYFERGKIKEYVISIEDFMMRMFPLMAYGGIFNIDSGNNKYLYFSKPAKDFAERMLKPHGDA